MSSNTAIIGGGVIGKATAKALGIKNIFDEVKKRGNMSAQKVGKFNRIKL